MKRPAFQFYPADWRKDVELRSCTVAARGLWIDLMCLAHECEPYGYLMVNGKAMTPAQIAGQIGLTAIECKRLMQELIDNGVARVNDAGAVYSKRMVDDERVRNARAEGGKAGAEHGPKGKEHGIKGGKKGGSEKATKGGSETPLAENSDPPSNPPPSSSSSSSASAIPSDPDGSGAAPPLSAKDRVWLLGPPLLGDTQPNRALLGKLAKTYGEDVLATVLAEATLEHPIDPKAWVTAACEAKGKARPKVNGNHAPQSTLDLLNRDPHPAWVIEAGFPDIFAAESAGCGPGNAAKFRDGRRLA